MFIDKKALFAQLQALKNSTYDAFMAAMKNVYQNPNNFALENKNNMNHTLTDKQLKSLIYHVATTLMIANHQTTNLEIKNFIHDLMPGIDLRQIQVSEAMDQLFNEKNEWIRDNSSSGGRYFSYSLIESDESLALSSTEEDDVDDEDDDEDSLTSSNLLNANVINKVIPANVATTGNNVSIINIAHHPASFLKTLDKRLMVASAPGYDTLIFGIRNRDKVKSLYHKETGALSRKIRRIRLSTYLKENNIS